MSCQNTHPFREATRRLISESLSTVADSDAIGEATRLVAEASALLAGLPHGRAYESAESSVTGDPHTSVFVSPFVGALNPLAPPLLVDMVDDTIVATGVFDDQYEGPPGYPSERCAPTKPCRPSPWPGPAPSTSWPRCPR